MKVLLAVCIFLFICNGHRSEVFTSISHMDQLVTTLIGTEKKLLTELKKYIKSEKKRLTKLERFAENVDNAIELSTRNKSTFLYNPVNAFQFVNRYSNGWMKLHELVVMNNSLDLISNISVSKFQFPSKEDLDGAIVALLRLQETYQLDSKVVARGSLGSLKGLSMISKDCFTIGTFACSRGMWRHCRQWMLTGIELLNEENYGSFVDDAQSVYEHLALSEFSLGNVKKGAYYNNELLKYNPNHERALVIKKNLNKLATEQPEKFVDKEEVEPVHPEYAKYEQLCREPAQTIASDLQKHLVCYYSDNDRNPRLILAPIKTEIISVKPDVYIYHDFVSDKEIERVKELAYPKLQRATIKNYATGELETVDYRVSKSGWLESSDDPLGYVDRVDQRIEDLTGLDMSTAESLQVVNYGIGGHYEPHYDFFSAGSVQPTTGNRISTFMIYLSDVEIGGATVFTSVGLRISPVKGSAIFWWNLKKSGEGDYLTKHAGCPVLVGSKWVCNKWIHERGQEFRFPCGLSVDD